MPVNSKLQDEVHPVVGVRMATVSAGVRYAGRLDLVLFELAPESTVAGVFTRNAFCAAPVQVARHHLGIQDARYLLINTGNANAGTGDEGVANAVTCCRAVADHAGVPVEAILPFSTGVIGERLPAGKVVAALPAAFDALDQAGWQAAARGIMTTDTRPKAASAQLDVGDNRTVTLTGIAKGAGMIRPDMATMLAFVCTDAAVDSVLLNQLLQHAVNKSFNRITVDGDTSTNDSCILVATGGSGVMIDSSDGAMLKRFTTCLDNLFQQLAMELIRDAEGATKFVTITVCGGADSNECLAVAYAVAESPLVKTALFASDPNWGRILAAVGRAGLVELDVGKISIKLGATLLVENGALAASYTEDQGQAEMDREEISITIDLARGQMQEIVWTSDLSEEYVRINADYRS